MDRNKILGELVDNLGNSCTAQDDWGLCSSVPGQIYRCYYCTQREAVEAAWRSREDLRKYGQHLAHCARWMELEGGERMIVPISAGIPKHAVCTCGFDEALKELDHEEAK